MTSDQQKQKLNRWYALIEKFGYIRTSTPDVVCKHCSGSGLINDYDLELALHSVEVGSELRQCDECAGLGIDLDAVESRLPELAIYFDIPGSVDEHKLLKCVDDEEELPGEMPDTVWFNLNSTKANATAVLRAVVATTKSNIRSRILRLLG